jgi:hypothetical protein
LVAAKEIEAPPAIRSASLTLPTFPLASVKELPVRISPLAGVMREESEATNSIVPAWTIPTVPSFAARTKTEGALEGAPEGAGVVGAPGPVGEGPLGAVVGCPVGAPPGA